MAISTFKTYLMKGTVSGNETTYTKLLDITSIPDLGGEPEAIDVTTLSDPMRKYIPGIKDNGNMVFEANYDKTDLASLVALSGQELKLAVWLGAQEENGVYTPDGSEGKFAFTGTVDAYVTGAGVNEAHKMNVVVTPTSKISFSAD